MCVTRVTETETKSLFLCPAKYQIQTEYFYRPNYFTFATTTTIINYR